MTLKIRIQRAVAAEYSAQLAEAGWFRRLRLQWKMRGEVRRRIFAEMPSDRTLW